MRKAAVIGGGAAGMMTAVLAAGEKTEIHLYEKNEKLGKKLFITGKGRCNVTNDCPTEEFFTNVVTNPKFLYSSAYSFDSAQVQEFFEAAGVRLKSGARKPCLPGVRSLLGYYPRAGDGTETEKCAGA